MSKPNQSGGYIPSLSKIASRFEQARISGFVAQCPACGSSSLKIFSYPDSMAVSVKCSAGCSRNVILGKVGLSASDLYPRWNGSLSESLLSKPLPPITPDFISAAETADAADNAGAENE